MFFRICWISWISFSKYPTKNNVLKKVVLLKVTGLILVIVKFRAEKILFRFLLPNLFLKNMKYQLYKQLCLFENERPILFSYTILFMISEKAYHKVHVFSPWCIHAPKTSRRHANFFWTLKLLLCGPVTFKNYINLHENTYLLTEGGRSFKTFLRKNYIIVLDSCYLFTKKCLTWNWKFTADLMNTMQFIRRWWIWHSVILKLKFLCCC